MTKLTLPSYATYHFYPKSSASVWLYLGFPFSLRYVHEIFTACGIVYAKTLQIRTRPGALAMSGLSALAARRRPLCGCF